MTTWLLVRHGATPWSVADRIAGTTPLPLAPHVREELSAFAKGWSGLTFSGVYCADTDPGCAAGVILAETLGLPIWEEPRLRPLDMGVWSGLSLTEVRQRFGRIYRKWQAVPQTYGPPEGETFWEAAERLRPFLRKAESGKGIPLVVAGRELLIALQLARLGPEAAEAAAPWELFPEDQAWQQVALPDGEHK